MCATCGCGNTAHNSSTGKAIPHDHDPSASHPPSIHPHSHATSPEKIISLEKDLLAKNDHIARHNRDWLRHNNILALNLVSSPGSGKTTLLERAIRDIGKDFPIFVIEGDQETSRDVERIRATGCRAIQINTGTGCHLDADRVGSAIHDLGPTPDSLLMIENVGNLVCPALFDLGEKFKVAILSVTEGDDKPLKYPHMFRAADIMVVNKIDLLPYVQFDVKNCIAYARRANPQIRVFELSATRGDGLSDWYQWLRQELQPASEKTV